VERQVLNDHFILVKKKVKKNVSDETRLFQFYLFDSFSWKITSNAGGHDRGNIEVRRKMFLNQTRLPSNIYLYRPFDKTR